MTAEPIDLAAAFPVCSCGEPNCVLCRRTWQLSPRMAAALRWAAAITADDAYDDIENHGDEPVPDNGWDWSLFDTYPHVTWAETVEWRRQAARAYDDLATDIDNGIWPLPRCSGEELALHTLLARLRDWTSDREAFPTLSEELAPLPPHPDDENWNGAWEHLFQDHDILDLYDGVSDAVAANVPELRWFDEFDGTEHRDPIRGFRR